MDIHMKLGETGEAFFVQDLEANFLDDDLHDLAKSDEEARSQDSGFEAEEPPSDRHEPFSDRHEASSDKHEPSADRHEPSANRHESPQTLKLRLVASEELLVQVQEDLVHVKEDLVQEEEEDDDAPKEAVNEQSSELGVVSRVPRQNSNKFVMKNIETQTEDGLQLVVDVCSATKEDTGNNSAETLRQKAPKKGDAVSRTANKGDLDSKAKDDSEEFTSKG